MLQCYLMRRTNNNNYIQPDSRGRIQLPTPLRHYPLFRFEKQSEGYLLTPLTLSAPPFKTENPSSNEKSTWLHHEVFEYAKKYLFKKLKQHLVEIKEVEAVFLYGSRARGDAISTSDFDIGLLVTSYPSFSRRHEITDELTHLLQNETQVLTDHGNHGEVSFHFFINRVDPGTVSPIYFSIFVDSYLIWERDNHWQIFVSHIKQYIRSHDVKSIGTGKTRRWNWKP